jgi:cell division protein FtsW
VVGALLFLVSWRLQRIMVFLHPNCDNRDAASAASYHVCQSLIAVGAGGLTGHGYMEGMQKLFYLPEASTDFIFANIAEELGFIGAFVIVALFVILGMRGMRTALRSRDPFARLASFGITSAILLQAFFNISVVLALVPTKGIPLPLISSGGTSLFFTLASIGVLLNISKKAD